MDTEVLITSFNGVSAFTAAVDISLLFEATILTNGGESVSANTLCILFDELSFDVRYRLFCNLGAFNRSIGSCFFFNDVCFRFYIVGSLLILVGASSSSRSVSTSVAMAEDNFRLLGLSCSVVNSTKGPPSDR